MNELNTPIYLDWTFWSAILSLIAIVLTQIPPLHLLFRSKRLAVDIYGKIQLFHLTGNPNASLVVSLHNTGGKSIRIKSIELKLARDGKPLVMLPGLTYFDNPLANTSILFIPFILKPDEIWTHSVVFYNEFDRETEKYFRQHESILRAYIQEELNKKNEKNTIKVEAPQNFVEPFHKLFDKLFIWSAGEYNASLIIRTENEKTFFEQKYRFTLYESDSNNLKLSTNDYKYGAGISYLDENYKGERITISKKD